MEQSRRPRGGAAVVLLLLVSCTRNAVAPPSPVSLERYVQARALYAEGRLDQALALLERNERESAGFAGNSFLLGKIYFFREDYDRARGIWQQALARNPHHLDTRKWLARLHLSAEQPELAEEVLAPALADSAEDPELLTLLGKALRQQGNLAGAIEALTKAQVFAERHAEASLELAEIYHGIGLNDRVQEQLTRAGSLLAEDSELSASIAVRLTRLRQEQAGKDPR